jgi:hypothetical protein
MTKLCVAVFALAAPVLTAQMPTDSARRAAIALFGAGDNVRLHVASGTLEGVFRSANATQVTIGDIDGVQQIPLAGVDTVWVRGNHWKTGGLLGLVGLGLPMGVALSGICESGGHCARAFIAGAVLGGFVGGSIGALLGSTFPKWERRFP